jgi:hypothetical protein
MQGRPALLKLCETVLTASSSASAKAAADKQSTHDAA